MRCFSCFQYYFLIYVFINVYSILYCTYFTIIYCVNNWIHHLHFIVYYMFCKNWSFWRSLNRQSMQPNLFKKCAKFNMLKLNFRKINNIFFMFKGKIKINSVWIASFMFSFVKILYMNKYSPPIQAPFAFLVSVEIEDWANSKEI